jgi:hypothetical protein
MQNSLWAIVTDPLGFNRQDVPMLVDVVMLMSVIRWDDCALCV